jgi:hypothetical protein
MKTIKTFILAVISLISVSCSVDEINRNAAQAAALNAALQTYAQSQQAEATK